MSVFRELTWKDGADSLGWRFGSLRLLCLVAVFLWHSQLWDPSVLDAVPLVQPPSYPNSMLSELTFFCSINRCFLVALYPLVPADWRVVFHPAGKGGCRQAWQAFLHSFKHSGAKSLFSKMSQDDNVGPLMLSVGEGTLSNQPCCSPRWEHTVNFLFFQGGRKASLQPAIQWVNLDKDGVQSPVPCP